MSLISYVVVDEHDPAFRDPSKPVGPFYTAEQAKGLPWPVRMTPKGYRRVVASPRPVTIVEKGEIRELLQDAPKVADAVSIGVGIWSATTADTGLDFVWIVGATIGTIQSAIAIRIDVGCATTACSWRRL